MKEAKMKKITKDIKSLLAWVPEGVDLERISRINYDEGVYEKGDGECPFFSEAYLYNLLGKEDARTLMALLKTAFESVGVNIRELF